jgi:hypothetical protein
MHTKCKWKTCSKLDFRLNHEQSITLVKQEMKKTNQSSNQKWAALVESSVPTRRYYVNSFPTILSIMSTCASGASNDVFGHWICFEVFIMKEWLVCCSGKFNFWWNRFGKMTLGNWRLGILHLRHF